MKKLLFLIIVMFLLGLPFSFAVNPAECGPAYIFCDIGDYQSFSGTNLTPANQDLLSVNGYTIPSDFFMKYASDENKIGNMSISTIGGAGIKHYARFDFGLYKHHFLMMLLIPQHSHQLVGRIMQLLLLGVLVLLH